jgi:membrane-bound metal-dependent hydrolase YbcI (DUF457 family)
MSPIGHLITAASLSTAYMRFNAVSWTEGISNLPKSLIEAQTIDPHSSAAITLIGLGILLGARGPDRLEVPVFNKGKKVRMSLIPHRTLTHWPLLWAILTGLSLFCMVKTQDTLFIAMSCVGFGFCIASWLHLAMDIMTPSGIPLYSPFGQKTSFNIYKTSSLGEWCCIFAFVFLTQFVSVLLT